MKLLHFPIVIVLGMNLSSCVTGPSTQEIGAINSVADEGEALARAHRITWVEASRRTKSKITQLAGDRLTDNDRLLLSYREALASEIDSGTMTPEVAKYKYEEKRMQINGAAAVRQQEISNTLISSGISMMQQQRPVTCTATQMGNMSTATCN